MEESMSDSCFWWGVFIASFSVALVVSAMCSIAESVLLSLSDAQIVEIGKKSAKIGAIWENFKKDPNAPITSILTINTTAHTIGASFAGASFSNLFGDTWIWLFSAIFTFLMLQYTEILPKTIGVRYNKRLAFWIARPLAFSVLLGDPIVHVLRFLNKPFEPKVASDQVTPVQQITLLTSLARRKSLLDAEQEKIILATLKMSTTEVRDVMVPIDEVSLLSDEMSTTEALEIAQNDSHTRFPVYYGDKKDLIFGYVNFKELTSRRLDPSDSTWNLTESSTDLSRFVRKIIRVESADKASDILNLLVKNHEHIALVVDADQKTNLGILTLEDLVEELVGEIEDEFDRLPETLHDYPDMIRAGGGAPIEKVCALAIKVFPGRSDVFAKEVASASPNQRLTGWIESKLEGRVARNARVDCGGLSFWIKRARRGQVFDVVILGKPAN